MFTNLNREVSVFDDKINPQSLLRQVRKSLTIMKKTIMLVAAALLALGPMTSMAANPDQQKKDGVERTYEKAKNGTVKVAGKVGEKSENIFRQVKDGTVKVAKKVGEGTAKTASKVGKGTVKVAKKVGKGTAKTASKVGKGTVKVFNKVKDKVTK